MVREKSGKQNLSIQGQFRKVVQYPFFSSVYATAVPISVVVNLFVAFLYTKITEDKIGSLVLC
jgi:hypothetical protein